MNRYIVIILFFVTLFSCQKNNLDRIVKLKTIELKVGFSVIVIESEIIDIGTSSNLEYGHCWAKHSSPTINDNNISHGQTDQAITYTDTLSGLETGVDYYVRPFAYDGENYYYGEEKRFNAGLVGLTILAEDAVLTGNYSATLSGLYSGYGSFQVNNAGISWSDDSTFQNNPNHIEFGNATLSFSSDLTNLEKKKTYYFRTFVDIAGSETQYSVTKSFELPTLALTTDTALVEGSNSILFNGNILSLSVLPADDHGFCWSTTTSHPTYNDSKVSLGQTNQTGVFEHLATGLAGGRTYYYRAWAKEEGHFVYGVIKSVFLP